MNQIKTTKHLITVQGGEDLKISLSTFQKSEGVDIINLSVESDVLKQMPKIEIAWSHPLINIHSYWYPTAFRNKSLNMDSNKGFFSKASISAPVSCFYDITGENRMTCAFSDALSSIEMNMGVHEEDGTLACKIILFNEPTCIKKYNAQLRIDTRDIPYYESLKDVSQWWESFEIYTPAYVPECARLPMYSTWYSFHQQIVSEEIEKQCEIAKKLGCEAVIVDDGWQTKDNNRGYAYCGDWEVAIERISDMKAHVKKVHELGMRYILWYSVPFIGIHSKAWSRFNDKLLLFIEDKGAGVLDPRYPEVREYLIEIYENAIKQWDIDGLKLDFIDEFDLPREKTYEKDKRRDYESVQEAVDCLLTDVIKKLKAIKPDVMIEFRQNYIGPSMRKYGNMLRVTDCPNNAITNRMGTMDIRLLCGNTATHSDMIMWNINDSVESAALQFINILFSVPQFSMRFDELSNEHFRMTKFWLAFWKQHKDVLLDGKLKPLYPELMYPIIEANTNKKRLIAVYSDFCISSGVNIPDIFIIVNGTLNDKVIIELDEDLEMRQLEVYDCCGINIKKEQMSLKKGIHKLDIPKSGIFVFYR